MKKISPVTLIVVFSVSISAASAQQAVDQKSKPATDGAANQTSATVLSTAELSPAPNNVAATGAEAQKHFDTAVALANEGRLAESIEAFKQSLKFRPDDPETNYTLGMTYAKSKSYKEAFESFKRVTRLKPEWPEGHFQLGTMSYVLGKRGQAKDEYKKLVQLNSSLAGILYRIINDDISTAEAEERINSNALTNSVSTPASVKVSETAKPEPAKPRSDRRAEALDLRYDQL